MHCVHTEKRRRTCLRRPAMAAAAREALRAATSRQASFTCVHACRSMRQRTMQAASTDKQECLQANCTSTAQRPNPGQ